MQRLLLQVPYNKSSLTVIGTMLNSLIARIASLVFKVRPPARAIAAQFDTPQGARVMLHNDGTLVFWFTGKGAVTSPMLSNPLHAVEMIASSGQVTLQEVQQGIVREIPLNLVERQFLIGAALKWLQTDGASIEVEGKPCL